jgi:glycosyltransferase involved in cell wall biosynthesis
MDKRSIMKLFLLADPNSSHTIKWARSLAKKGVDILIFGLGRAATSAYDGYHNIRVVSLGQSVSRDEAAFGKLRYLGAVREVKKLIRQFMPDIVHAHYATSYGLIGALSGFHPFVLSVWGSDVFSFPTRSVLHRMLFRHNLRRADQILSTSHVMALETAKYTAKPIEVTPFGIDLAAFAPLAPQDSLFAEGDIVIGTVKAMDEKYGIEYLIRAFDVVRRRHPALPLKLLLVGGGPLQARMEALARELGLGGCAVFAGQVAYDEVPRYQNMLSISVSVSVVSESFGVAVIEAGACEKPVVVSNMGGLPEVVENEVTGIVVPPRDVAATAAAIERLVCDAALRARMGRAGRKRVRRLYDWQDNVARMMDIYAALSPAFARRAAAPRSAPARTA